MKLTLEVDTENEESVRKAIHYLQSLLSQTPIRPLPIQQIAEQQSKRQSLPTMQTTTAASEKSAADLLEEADQELEFTDF